MDGGIDPTDIFSQFFGGGSRARGQPKPKDIIHQLPVPLQAFYCGKVIKLAVTRQRLCSKCGGSGSKIANADVKCKDCNGRGVRMVTRQLGPGFIQQMQMTCSTCQGKGTTLKDEDKCETCKGKQTVTEKKIFEVVVEKGMHSGDSVSFRGQGDQLPGVRLAGDIIIILQQKPHKLYTRKGDHLFIEHTISLAEALTGFTFNLTQLDDRKLQIQSTHNNVIDPAKLYSVYREGMPKRKTGGMERGDLLIKFIVIFPTSLNDAAVTKIREVLQYPPQPSKDDEAEQHILQVSIIDLQKESRGNAYDDDDEESDGRPRAQTATCAQQ